ncbi:sulfotransferase [Defluviimonas sp. WL0050]|uniref:Sulfotransferase n=1 Tax=Albidovulum litorale TaxID=2984134 RepID=A0ABT2ZRI4_9RHOB|nr:tetratricopeptide repeat-containing sulfotransferase family protein [Defluviimonas sp. WL0050]MCV2873754.1 sulfotransferase [Defluviimonas sp. WL0050]
MMAVLSASKIQATYAKALKLQTEKDFKAALQTYGRILKSNPDIAEAHYQIGRILCQTDAAIRALPHLRKAVELRPNERAVWEALAEGIALGGTRAQEAEFLRDLKQSRIPPEAKLRLQDRFGSLRAASRPATGGMPIDDIHRLLGQMSLGRFADVERAAALAVKKFPKSAVAFNILGAASMILGKTQQAGAAFKAAVRLDPNYAEAYEYYGRLCMEAGRDDEAGEYFRRAVILAPGLLSALGGLASLQTKLGHAAAALPLLERAIEIDSNSADIYRALGNALSRLRKYEAAEQALQKAVDLHSGPVSADMVALLAQSKARLGKDEDALGLFDRALDLNPDAPLAVSGKAQLLQTLGRFDDAKDLFEKGFEIDPNNGENYRLFSASYKAKAGDPFIGMMRKKYEDPALGDSDRMNLGFAIAKSLEDIKDYPEVFRYLDEANALMRKAFPYDVSRRRKDVELVQKAFGDFDWYGAKVEGTTDFAPIFVTGMPRSGTTLIEQIISSHSNVTGAGEVGEAAGNAHAMVIVHGRNRQMSDVPHEEIAKLGHDYEAFIHSRFPEAQQITDKSIQSYMSLGALKLAMPKARFVVVRRDPRDNLLSIYKNKFPDDTHLYAYDQRDLGLYYDTFVDMIDFWRERVPDWFYEVQYEELVANPEEETRKLIAACGLEWEDACLNFHENKRKIETLSVYQARQPISKASVALWQRYEKDLKPMLDALKEGGHVPG